MKKNGPVLESEITTKSGSTKGREPQWEAQQGAPPRVGGDAEVRGRLHQPSGADPQNHRGRYQRRDGRGGGNMRHGRIGAQGRVRRRQTRHRRRDAPARRTARPIAMETGGITPKAAWPRHGVRILGEGTDPSEPGRPRSLGLTLALTCWNGLRQHPQNYRKEEAAVIDRRLVEAVPGAEGPAVLSDFPNLIRFWK